MKSITEILTEARDSKGGDLPVIPVMFNIYGDPIGNPWYFGYTNQEQVGKQMGAWSTDRTYSEWAKIVVPFEKFDPNNLAKNLKYNLIK